MTFLRLLLRNLVYHRRGNGAVLLGVALGTAVLTGALLVGVGSSGNLGVEPEPKATVQRFDADGSNQTTFATGTRNATALAFHPTTGELWAVGFHRAGPELTLIEHRCM